MWYHSDSVIDSIFKIKTALVPLQQCRYLPTRNAQWGCVHLTKAPEEFGELRHAKALTAHVQPSLPWPDTVLWWELCARDTSLCLFSWYPSFLHSHYMVYFGATKISQNSLADVPYSTNGLFKSAFIFYQSAGTAFRVHVKQTAAEWDRRKSEINKTFPRVNGEMLHRGYAS